MIGNYIIGSKLNNIHTFVKRMQHNENDVFTEIEEFIFKSSIKYEFQKLLRKLDELNFPTFVWISIMIYYGVC